MQPTTKNKVSFDVQKENGVLFDAQDEFIDKNQTSTSVVVPVLDGGRILDMPQRFQNLFRIKTIEKGIKLKNLFKSCLALIEYKDVVAELSYLVEKSQPSV